MGYSFVRSAEKVTFNFDSFLYLLTRFANLLKGLKETS